MHTPFGVTISDATIRVDGDVDMAVTDQLVAAITCCAATVDRPVVVLDLAGLTFLDSTGIDALIRSHQDLERMGKQLVLQRVPDRVHRTLVVAGVGDYLNVAQPSAGPPVS